MITRQTEFHCGVLRQAPAGLDPLTSAAVRGGHVRVVDRGRIVWLPLGSRLIDRLRRGLASIGAAWGTVISDLALPSASLADIVASEIRSHRDLPAVAAAEWRGETAAARSLKDELGLGGVEWVALAEAGGAPGALSMVADGLTSFLRRCGLSPLRVLSGEREWEWACPDDEGAWAFLRCDGCRQTAAVDVATFAAPPVPAEAEQPLREVATPGASTIKILCDQLGVAPSRTLKALFLTTAEGQTLLALLRGDLEASFRKLSDALGTSSVRPATQTEVAGLGAVAGYAGPVGLQPRVSRASPGVWIVVDRSVPLSPNLATGANREGYHLTGVNYPRDFAATEILDFAMAPPGARCDQCGGRLVEERGFRIGSERLIPHRFAFAAADGRETMGDIASLRVRLDALFASVYRAARQASGVRFAPACAPFHVHLLSLPGGLDLDPVAQALDEAGLDVLLDDRNAPAGEKFAEADWIGAPVRVTSGRKSAQQNGVEVRWGDGRAEVLAVEQAAQAVLAQVRAVM